MYQILVFALVFAALGVVLSVVVKSLIAGAERQRENESTGIIAAIFIIAAVISVSGASAHLLTMPETVTGTV